MDTHFDPFEELANAIIVQAAKDYKDVLEGCTENKLKNRKELEQFFRSEYFTVLTSLDGELLMERLRQTVREEQDAKRQKNISRHRKSIVEDNKQTLPPVDNSLIRYKDYVIKESRISA